MINGIPVFVNTGWLGRYLPFPGMQDLVEWFSGRVVFVSPGCKVGFDIGVLTDFLLNSVIAYNDKMPALLVGPGGGLLDGFQYGLKFFIFDRLVREAANTPAFIYGVKQVHKSLLVVPFRTIGFILFAYDQVVKLAKGSMWTRFFST